MTLSMVMVWAAGIALTAIVCWYYPGHDGDLVETDPVETPSPAASQGPGTTRAAEDHPEAPVTPVPVDAGQHEVAEKSRTDTGANQDPIQATPKPEPTVPAPAEAARAVPPATPAPKPVATAKVKAVPPVDSTPTTPDEDPPLAPPSW